MNMAMCVARWLLVQLTLGADTCTDKYTMCRTTDPEACEDATLASSCCFSCRRHYEGPLSALSEEFTALPAGGDTNFAQEACLTGSHQHDGKDCYQLGQGIEDMTMTGHNRLE